MILVHEETNHWNRIEDREVDSLANGNLLFANTVSQISGRNMDLMINDIGITG